MVCNSSGQTATVKTASGTAGQVLDTETRFFYCDGTDIHSLTDVSDTGSGSAQFAGSLVTLSADETVATSTDTALQWGTESFDTDDFHDPSVLPSRFTVPSGVSSVILTAEIRWDTNNCN